MARKCPPGVFCIENVTITFLMFLIVLLILYLYYSGTSFSLDKDEQLELIMKFLKASYPEALKMKKPE